MSAVVYDRIQGKVECLGCREELDECLRVSASAGRCAKKITVGVSTVDVWLKYPEANKDGSQGAEERNRLKCQ